MDNVSENASTTDEMTLDSTAGELSLAKPLVLIEDLIEKPSLLDIYKNIKITI